MWRDGEGACEVSARTVLGCMVQPLTGFGLPKQAGASSIFFFSCSFSFSLSFFLSFFYLFFYFLVVRCSDDAVFERCCSCAAAARQGPAQDSGPTFQLEGSVVFSMWPGQVDMRSTW